MSNPEIKNDIKKLFNFLKLPKAHRWICCEWFYSDIDKVIFESENDFSICLKQSFPRLKSKKLKRKQWCIIRNLIGKPRRCSDAFFQEERQILEEKRKKIRLIQQRKIDERDLDDLKDLPQEIPLTLSIGHRVYCHITYPEEGVFIGTIAAVDHSEHTYRIVFDRPSLGSQTVYDYKIKSLTPAKTIPIRAYIQTFRPKQILNNNNTINSINQSHLQTLLVNSPSKISFYNNNILTPISSNKLLEDINSLSIAKPSLSAALMFSDPTTTDPFHNDFLKDNKNNKLVSFQNKDPSSNVSTSGTLGGFPISLILMVSRLNKIINCKKELIRKQSEMNTEAERVKAQNKTFSTDFQIKYASLVFEIEKLNGDLQEYLSSVERFLIDYSNKDTPKDNLDGTNKELIENNHKHESFLYENHNKLHYLNESNELINKLGKIKADTDVAKNSHSKDNQELTSSRKLSAAIKSKTLVSLTSLLLQFKDLIKLNSKFINDENIENSSVNQINQVTFKHINHSINEIKKNLSVTNAKLFEDKIQIHLKHIESVFCHYDKLHAFNFNIDE